MSGHSKWSTIKNKKEKADNERAKVFTKIGREISVAVKMGGADPSTNKKLKDVILKAKANNVPNSNIDRIIKKAAGDGQKNNFLSITYEGYGPEGVAVFVNALTDNKNRTAANVRHYFDKFGGNLGASGCVSYLFEKKGVIYLKIDKDREEETMEKCIGMDALDFEFDDGIAKVTTNSDKFSDFVEKLKEEGYEFLSAAVEEVPGNYVEIKSEDNKEKMEKLIKSFEDDEDIQEIFTNYKDF